MKHLQRIWQNFYQNFDFYITVVTAAVIGVFGIVGVANQAIIASAILATLGLVSFSLLKNRRQDDGIRNAILEIKAREDLSSRSFRQGFNAFELRDAVIHAKEVVFWGLSFTTALQTLDGAIGQALKNGCKIYFLIPEPYSCSTKLYAFRNYLNQDRQEVNNLLLSTLNRLSKIAKATSNSSGVLEIKVVDYLPSWTMIAINPHNTQGVMTVRLNVFRLPNDVRPYFEFTRAKDNKWFQFFWEQFETIWGLAKAVDVKDPLLTLKPEPTATSVKVTNKSLEVSLTDKRTITVPLEWYPHLISTSTEEKRDWQLLKGERATQWLVSNDIKIEDLC